jgi:sulfite reductase alpha subunit-like flavoprotein
VVFLLTSTTGSGDPPHHAIGFKSSLEDAQLTPDGQKLLKGVRYAVFALGSTAYEMFCTFGKECDASLHSLGGERIASIGLGDEQKGQDRCFRNWTMAAFTGACEAINIAIPGPVEKNWPFAKLRKQASASWSSHSFKTTNNIKGK